MKRESWLRVAGIVGIVAALGVIGLGCSGSSPSVTAPTQDKIGSNDIMLGSGPSIGNTPEFPFEFTGQIDRIAPDDNFFVLREKGLVIRISDKTEARLTESSPRTGFRFDFVDVGTEITVYGSVLKDNSVEAELIDVLPTTSTTTESSNQTSF